MPKLISPANDGTRSIILIGMAGAGKSTLGGSLAKVLNWGHVDTDHILEAWWGMDLHTLSQSLTREEFLDAEARMIQGLDIKRTVISTGGSVVYDHRSMRHLHGLGVCIYLEASLPTIRERIAKAPLRGLAIAPGQSIEELYAERVRLYEREADITVQTDILTLDRSIAYIVDRLGTLGIHRETDPRYPRTGVYGTKHRWGTER
ncbi:homoserine kinase [Desulfoplanes sp.]